MRSPLRLLTAAALLALVLAACGEEAEEPEVDLEAPAEEEPAEEPEPADEPEPEEEPAEEPEPEDEAAADDAAVVATASTDLGTVLVDGEGFVLYMFDVDEGGVSACYDDCANAWPALVTEGDPTAGEGADSGLLGTTERDDGTTQVTYAGHPLYYFAGDNAAGDVNGQGVNDVWWVLDPSGDAIGGNGGDDEAEDTSEANGGTSPY